ncbi:MAG TPA: SCO family protein [Cyclobacteriaceae bacterium]|nr:SCO family protein [Cyclobacteriaceae bacterium]
MRSFLKTSIVFILTAAVVLSCKKSESRLPIFGERDFNGKDTVYHTIAPFSFLDQDSTVITNDTFKDKIYVADFFFTTCRTICPIMKTQMKRVYDATANQPDVLILSHTIDPEYDTVALLRNFAKMLEVSSDRWHFVTGEKDSIYKIAQTSYFVTAREERAEPDGFIHSGAFMLIDKKQRIRGKYDGTRQVDVDRMLKDIAKLRNESE